MSRKRDKNRQAKRADAITVARTKALVTCPDCTSDVHLLPTGRVGVVDVQIVHDDTCPRLDAMRRGTPS